MSRKRDDFESKLKRLEEITGKLESGSLGLEESIEAYKEGIELARSLILILKDAEKKIQLIQREGISEFDDIKELENKLSDYQDMEHDKGDEG
ncbi:MAG: exodeoxyribonuclease VII small subunit [Deltaproteobacteria bacterium]|nr:exodeoxyribonuclease VII small subunit [Deltaproteobacteria bacterium]